MGKFEDILPENILVPIKIWPLSGAILEGV